jgi:hypothetical protein
VLEDPSGETFDRLLPGLMEMTQFLPSPSVSLKINKNRFRA